MQRAWLLFALAVAPACVEAPDESIVESAANETIARPFRIRAVGNKCVDAFNPVWQAPGSAVYLYTCNNTDAQRFLIYEHLDGSRDVSIRTPAGWCLGVRSYVWYGQPLELQTCDGRTTQRFALDGDALYVGRQSAGARVNREFVIEAQAQRGADFTPLVVGGQETDPNEDLRFQALSLWPRPTSGFVYVPSDMSLPQALANASWGTVIEVAPSQVITDYGGHSLQAGVTLRGGQAARYLARAEIRIPEDMRYPGLTFLRIAGERTRITGIKLRGPSTETANSYQYSTWPGQYVWVPFGTSIGIQAHSGYTTVIDHNDISAFPNSSIAVNDDRFEADFADCEPINGVGGIVDPRPVTVWILQNFIHENRRDSKGYGVVMGDGGFAYIGGNTFDDNRHAIAADGRTHTGYRALGNIVMHNAPWQGTHLWETQDFDMHGRGEGGWGGVAGAFVEIGSNTFLGDREAYELRGRPCRNSSFHHNSVHQDWASALETYYDGTLNEFNNDYEVSDPTNMRAPRGDFDGDGKIDDFMATGAGWYFVSNNIGPWRYLRMATERVSSLGFSDLDGDGRTDIWRYRADGYQEASWGGTSPWVLTGARR